MVQVGAAAVPEHVAGVAKVLQVAGLHSFIHYGPDAISGYATQKVPIKERINGVRTPSFFILWLVGWPSGIPR